VTVASLLTFVSERRDDSMSRACRVNRNRIAATARPTLRRILGVVATLLMSGCAGTLDRNTVEDLRAVPQRAQTTEQQEADYKACLKHVSGAAAMWSMGLAIAERNTFTRCMEDRGYAVSVDPSYTPRGR